MLINKRRNSGPAAGDNADLDITAPRQTERTATELFSFAIIWWSFLEPVRFFNVDGIWGPEGSVSRIMVVIYIYKLSFDDLYFLTTFFKVNLSYILMGYCFNSSFLLFYLGLDMSIFSVDDSGGNITKHHKKRDAPPPVTQNFVRKPSSSTVGSE